MYKCIVTNYGYARMSFPTRIGNLFIPRLMPFPVHDPGVVEDLRRFEQSDKLGFEVAAVDAENGHPQPISRKKIDPATPIQELRHIAAKAGIKETFSMKKSQLIQKLEEKNGTKP